MRLKCILHSLSTLHREYAALMALPYYDMVDVILRPRLSDPVIASAMDVERTMRAIDPFISGVKLGARR